MRLVDCFELNPFAKAKYPQFMGLLLHYSNYSF